MSCHPCPAANIYYIINKDIRSNVLCVEEAIVTIVETGITVGMDVEETAADVAAAIVGTITAETVGKIILVPEHLTKVSRVDSTRDFRAEEMTTGMM